MNTSTKLNNAERIGVDLKHFLDEETKGVVYKIVRGATANETNEIYIISESVEPDKYEGFFYHHKIGWLICYFSLAGNKPMGIQTEEISASYIDVETLLINAINFGIESANSRYSYLEKKSKGVKMSFGDNLKAGLKFDRARINGMTDNSKENVRRAILAEDLPEALFNFLVRINSLNVRYKPLICSNVS